MVEWFENTTWNESVEQMFEQKLRRARRKEQYLRAQASYLADSHPQVALALLGRYFAMPNQQEQAWALAIRAQALIALGRIDEAIESYEAALAREAAHPNRLTQAYRDLPFLIATQRVTTRYARALKILKEHQSRLRFPLDYFRWNAAYALIAAESDAVDVAEEYAKNALRAWKAEHSGMPRHPTFGLVGDVHDDVIRRLEACVSSRNPEG
jgi:tetratricopeptide (TPR) repeat protein